MTREQQLDWLCRLRSEIYVYMPQEWIVNMDEALTQSIKTLEQEQKTGHWIENKGNDIRDKFYTCSKCGRTINIIAGDTLENYSYCHCGSKNS